jgi:hypothetical protein
MRMLSMHSTALVFFCFFGFGLGGFLSFISVSNVISFILIMFSKDSPHAFSRTFPIAPPFYPTLFGHSLTFMYKL